MIRLAFLFPIFRGSQHKARATALTIRALALEDVAAICAIDVPAARTCDLVHVLIVVCARRPGIANRDLPVWVGKARVRG